MVDPTGEVPRPVGDPVSPIEKLIRRLASRLGYEVRRREPAPPPPDLERDFLALFEACKPYTRTSVERMYALYQATQYIVRAGIPGAIVECGVWRGGSAMIAAMTLAACKDTARDLWLYDTYEGMSEPSEHDRDWRGISAAELMRKGASNKETSVWCYASIEDVRGNMGHTGYPAERMHFIKGKVEDSIPAEAPPQIALLRLDTDFYESTYHELQHLYPRLAPGGVLIIDDYGHWAGARKATDQYFAELGRPLLLQRIDYTGRMAVVGAR
jgi:O-methyltransferase